MSTPPPQKPEERKTDEIPWRRIAFVAVAVYAVLFLLLNDDRVGVSFVLFTAHTSLVFLILISMGLGAALALFGPALWKRRRRSDAAGTATAVPAEPEPERLTPPADPQ